MTAPSPADSTGSRPTLTVTPDPADVTDRLSIAVTGLDPGQRVTLEAAFADLGTEWAGEAAFEVDADGRVDLTECAPVAGDYDGVRLMGLVQFAERVSDDPVDTRAGTDATNLELTARVDGEVVAEATVTRRVAPGVERTELDPGTDGVAGDLYVPEGDDGPHPGVLALHGSGGEPIGRKARALAAEGYAVLALRYFGGPAPVPERFAEVSASYAGNAIDFLHGREDVADDNVGVLGASRGTELALLTAAERDDVSVVVAYAPSAYAWFGERDGDGETGPPPSAWTVAGDPLPLLPHPGPDGRPEETDRGLRSRATFEGFVGNAGEDALVAARLPVEAVAADVVLISGTDDGVWPADEMADTVVDAMTDAPGSAAHHRFEDAGHSFFLPYHPTTERAVAHTDDGPDMVHGGTPAGTADADRDSWTVALDALASLEGDR